MGRRARLGSCGWVRAGVAASLRTTDFSSFRAQLEKLYEELKAEAAFETMEEWLSIELSGDGRGHVETRAEVTDAPGTGNRLRFSISGIDQTHLVDVVARLVEIEGAFPTIGSPAA